VLCLFCYVLCSFCCCYCCCFCFSVGRWISLLFPSLAPVRLCLIRRVDQLIPSPHPVQDWPRLIRYK
jgi:hypothetical protein